MLPMDGRALEHLHRFHPYCARYPTEIVEAALTRYSKPGESVLDPFCGSGTTLVGCLAHGRRTVGADVDVLAGMLTEVKCRPRSRRQYDSWRAAFATRIGADFREIAGAWTRRTSMPLGTSWQLGALKLTVPSFPELPYWF